MNFNKEIKYTHDEIQKLHQQFDQLNESLAKQFQDIANVVKEHSVPYTMVATTNNNDTKKIEVVVKHEELPLLKYTMQTIIVMNVCLMGWFVNKAMKMI